MNGDGGFFTDGTRYIVLGILLILFMGLIMVIPRREERHDTELVEVHVVGKEIVEIDEKAVYLIHTEDRYGVQAIYEIAESALNERFKIENVYKEIKKEKYYRFRVGEADHYGCYYPCICGAATLIDGFTEETSKAE